MSDKWIHWTPTTRLHVIRLINNRTLKLVSEGKLLPSTAYRIAENIELVAKKSDEFLNDKRNKQGVFEGIEEHLSLFEGLPPGGDA